MTFFDCLMFMVGTILILTTILNIVYARGMFEHLWELAICLAIQTLIVATGLWLASNVLSSL